MLRSARWATWLGVLLLFIIPSGEGASAAAVPAWLQGRWRAVGIIASTTLDDVWTPWEADFKSAMPHAYLYVWGNSFEATRGTFFTVVEGTNLTSTSVQRSMSTILQRRVDDRFKTIGYVPARPDSQLLSGAEIVPVTCLYQLNEKGKDVAMNADKTTYFESATCKGAGSLTAYQIDTDEIMVESTYPALVIYRRIPPTD